MTVRTSGVSGVLTNIERRRRPLRIVFWIYATLLFVGTHIPRFDVRVPGVERPDLFVHLAVFAAWFVLLWMSALCGPLRRYRSLLMAAVVAVAYAAVDEGLQALPFVDRNCAWDDLLANWAGIALAALATVVLVWSVRQSSSHAPTTL